MRSVASNQKRIEEQITKHPQSARHCPTRGIGVKAALMREATLLDRMNKPGGDEIRVVVGLLTERSFDRIAFEA